MSFGFSVGDFIAAGQLAHSLRAPCRTASGAFEELGNLCRDISFAVDACLPNSPCTVLQCQQPDTLALLAAHCYATLNRLQVLLGKNQSTAPVPNIGRRLDPASVRVEQQHIRNRLLEHLATINTIFSGKQIGKVELAGTLLRKHVEERNGGGEVDLEAICGDPEKLKGLLKDFSLENGLSVESFAAMEDGIKEKLKETLLTDEDDTEASSPKTLINWADSESLCGPTVPSTNVYDPTTIDWFQSCLKWLSPLTVHAATTFYYKPAPAVMRYSERDEWLSMFPEGWSMVPTLVSRGARAEEGYYYVCNNLESAATNLPQTSRPYCFHNPFMSGYDYPSVEPEKMRPMWPPKTRFTWAVLAPQAGYHRAQAWIKDSYAGFHLRGVPFDLSDPISRDLVHLLVGNNGIPMQYSYATIENRLPDDWTWDPEGAGKGRHIYINAETGAESTVHPAHFYSPDVPTSLPPGWDRRLDSWGNLFFVDHNTCRAVREDPRFNRKINQETGLPLGWLMVLDHRKRPFYYKVNAKTVMGTYFTDCVSDKSIRGKVILSRVPETGEDPKKLDIRRQQQRGRLRIKSTDSV